MDSDADAGFEKQFIEKNRAAFERDKAEQQHRSQVAERFRNFNDQLTRERDKLSSLRDQISFVEGSDIPASLLEIVSNSPGSAADILQYASNFTGAMVLKRYGPEILKLAEAQLLKLQTEYEKFVRENKTLLKELSLI